MEVRFHRHICDSSRARCRKFSCPPTSATCSGRSSTSISSRSGIGPRPMSGFHELGRWRNCSATCAAASDCGLHNAMRRLPDRQRDRKRRYCAMRAVVITAPGVENNLKIGVEPKPDPSPGLVLVDVAYGGCNFADTMIVKGTYPHPKGYPLVGGLEISGHVAAVGPGVDGVKAGDRVAAFLEEAGGFADQCVVPVERLIPIPPKMGLDVAAAFPIQALTSWHLLHTVSTTRPGDVILIHAIGGGVGLFLTQIAVRAGATVIGTVGTKGKEKRA